MSRQQILDVPGGDHVTYDVVTDDGFCLYPFFDEAGETKANFEKILNKKCRTDDILLNSFPKTGTHWLWDMMYMLLQGRVVKAAGDKNSVMMEGLPEETIDAVPSPRILNTHIKYKYIPKDVREKRLKCILLCRNPKDTAVSFYNHMKGIAGYHYDGKFDNFLQMFMNGKVDFGSYPEYLMEWQQAIKDNPDWQVHIVYYEDLKHNTATELRKLARYLDLDVAEDTVRGIAVFCQIDKVRKRKEEGLSEEERKQQQQWYKSGFNMLRKGQVGDWKNWFTVAQNERFDKWWAENTQGLDIFTFKYA